MPKPNNAVSNIPPIKKNNIDCTKLPKKFYPYMKDILDFFDVQPTVEAIPKDQYEARLKADELDMLAEIKNNIEVLRTRPDILGNDEAQEIILAFKTGSYILVKQRQICLYQRPRWRCI